MYQVHPQLNIVTGTDRKAREQAAGEIRNTNELRPFWARKSSFFPEPRLNLTGTNNAGQHAERSRHEIYHANLVYLTARTAGQGHEEAIIQAVRTGVKIIQTTLDDRTPGNKHRAKESWRKMVHDAYDDNLTWIFQTCIEMAIHYEQQRWWQDQPWLLHISYPENSLSPERQERLIPAIMENLPGLRILAVTTSDSITKKLQRGTLHTVTRNRDSGIVLTATHMG